MLKFSLSHVKHRFLVLSSSFFVCVISPDGVVALAIGGLRITTPGANIKAAAKAARTPKMLRINAVTAEGSFGECGGLTPLWYCVLSASLFGPYSFRHPTDNRRPVFLSLGIRGAARRRPGLYGRPFFLDVSLPARFR